MKSSCNRLLQIRSQFFREDLKTIIKLHREDNGCAGGGFSVL